MNFTYVFELPDINFAIFISNQVWFKDFTLESIVVFVFDVRILKTYVFNGFSVPSKHIGDMILSHFSKIHSTSIVLIIFIFIIITFKKKFMFDLFKAF